MMHVLDINGRVRLLCVSLLLLARVSCGAQDFAVGVNAADLLNFGTLNVSAGYALSRHWSVEAEVRLNPWQFGRVDGSAPFRQIVEDVRSSVLSRRESFTANFRWWPWYFQSEGWLSIGATVCSYDRGGWFFGPQRHKGLSFGGVLGVGWMFMLSKNLGLDVGVRGWAGMRNGRVYKDLYFMNEFEQERGFAAGLDEVVLSFVYCF